MIARIAELESDAAEELDGKPIGLADEEADELRTLRTLAEQGASACPDWEWGETLVRDSHFEDYARELAEDCGMIPDNLAWPCTCIDWERAARELRMDYTSIDFDGVTYWAR